MNQNRMEPKSNTVLLLRIAAYLLAVLLLLSGIAALCAPSPLAVEFVPGAIDLSGVDLDGNTVEVERFAFLLYPGAFYPPEDFASGSVEREGVPYGTGVRLSDFGTLRLELTLPSPSVYAIAGKNVSYAQRLYINGEEIGSVGGPADTLEGVEPKATRFFEAFQTDEDGKAEIVIHYAAFVFSDGGGLYNMELGHAGNVARSEQVRILFTALVASALAVALLLFVGLYLLFPRNAYLLWFALACGCLALRNLLVSDKIMMVVLPDLNWFLAIRLEFITSIGIALFSCLYLHSLFPGKGRRRIVWASTAWCLGGILYVWLTPPYVFSLHIESIIWVCAVFLVCLLAWVLIDALRRRLESPLTGIQRLLLLGGLVFYVGLSVAGIYAHPRSMLLFGKDFPDVAMIVFLFVNIIVLILTFSRTERELDTARAAQWEMAETNRTMERLNKIRALYFANITHEIKTPLAGIQAIAKYCKARLGKSGALDQATLEDLDEIAQRAGELADQTGGLLKLTAAQEGRYNFRPVDVAGLLAHTSQAVDSMMRERGNRLTMDAPSPLPPLLGAADLLSHVLANLIANANRACKDGVITLSAKAADGIVEFQVADRGRGVPAELLPRVFEWGVSGDGGSGLGLAICKDVVEAHGGEIAIDSLPGQGTRVRFTIPIAREDAAQ